MVAAHLPLEMIEEILLNLPVKSLLRFSSVSKLWNSTIFEPRFTRKNIIRRAAVIGRDRLVVYINPDTEVSSLHALSSVPSNPPIDIEIDLNIKKDVNDIDCICSDFSGQFEREKPYLRAFCDELWLVKHEGSLFLWNPSMRSKAKLPSPLFAERTYVFSPKFIYGFGYDCVGDDYKILKIGDDQSELYSLKDNYWRKVESPYATIAHAPSWHQKGCPFVDGILHWICLTEDTQDLIIVSFNLSTEKYGEVALPQDSKYFTLDVAAVRGMLTVNYLVGPKFVMWVMEEYGVEKSWTKKFDILYWEDTLPPYYIIWLQPLYFYDNNDILIKAYDYSSHKMEIVLYKNSDKDARPTQAVRCSYSRFLGLRGEAFFYVESLISPKPPRANNE